MKKILFLLLMVASSGWAQSLQKSALLTYGYDLTSTSYIYCRYLGANGDPWGVAGGNPSPAVVETSGSSTTVTASTASTNPFAQVAVGDMLFFNYGGATYLRRVVTRTSADEVVVDAAVNLGTTGVHFQWWKQECGTAATDGWLDVSLFYNVTFIRNIETLNATSIDSQVECRSNSAAGAAIIDTKNATAIGVYAVSVTSGAYEACRLGMKVNTDTGAQRITAAVSYNR